MRTIVAGTSEEGRDILIAFITSEQNLKNLEQNRQNLKRSFRPSRTQRSGCSPGSSLQRNRTITSQQACIVAETSPGEMVMELAYRLAVSDEPYIQEIRNNVVVSIAPTTDLDGRDRYVDWYYAPTKSTNLPKEGLTFGGPPYWGKYIFPRQ